MGAEEKTGPILRWAGSKRVLLPQLVAASPDDYTRYVEPFMGSAALFFALRPMRALLADVNADVVNVHRALKRDGPELYKAVEALKVGEPQYYAYRDEFNKTNDLERRAILFLYLNRFCFNGVYRTNKEGAFNTPVGRKTGAIPALGRFIADSDALRAAEVSRLDFRETMSQAEAGDFVYMDPPYLSERPTYGEYGYGSFDPSEDLPDFLDLVQTLHRQGTRMVISYTDDPRLRTILSGWNINRLMTQRRVAGKVAARREGAPELIASNFPRGTA